MKKIFNDNRLIKSILVGIMILLSLPIAYVFRNALTRNTDYLNLIMTEGILAGYAVTTIELIIKVAISSSVIGFMGAYVMSMYDFKFKKAINILFIMPFSIPIYVGAYMYTEIYFDIPFLESMLKNDFTMNGAVFIYTIFLYPYVYLASRSYLNKNMAEYVQASQTLGVNNIGTFFRVILPLSRPVIVASTLFVIFETLSDFAVLEYYGVETLSKIINDSWKLLAEKDTASKISSMLLFIIFILIVGERFSRGRKRNNALVHKKNRLIIPKNVHLLFIYSFYFVIISLGFLLPLKEVINGVLDNYAYFIDKNLFQTIINTLTTAIFSIVLILIVAMFLSSTLKVLKDKNKNGVTAISMLGYSIPSSVLALGVYTFLLNIDKNVFPFAKQLGATTYILTGTRIALIVGLSIKFMSIAFSQFSNIYEKVDKSIFEAAYNLKHNFTKTFFSVDFFILLDGVKYIVILLLIDLLKELTITYSIRPFNFRTLSTEIYRYAGNEMLGVSAIPSFIIITIIIAFIFVLEGGNKDAKSK